MVAALAASAAVHRRWRRSQPPAGGRAQPPTPAAGRSDLRAQRYSMVDVLALDVASFLQPLAECGHDVRPRRRPAAENPITGIAGCCARAASGHAAAAAPPSSVMNSRRLTDSPSTGQGRTLPHHCVRKLPCIAAKLIVEWQRWVNQRRDSAPRWHSRSTFNSGSVLAAAGTAGECQFRTRAPQPLAVPFSNAYFIRHGRTVDQF